VPGNELATNYYAAIIYVAKPKHLIVHRSLHILSGLAFHYYFLYVIVSLGWEWPGGETYLASHHLAIMVSNKLMGVYITFFSFLNGFRLHITLPCAPNLMSE